MGLFRTRRGLSLLAFATVVALGCVLLGVWQLERYQLRSERNEAIRSALAAEPVPLDAVVPPGTSIDDVDPAVQWRSVTVRGEYDDAATLTLRLRPVEGQSGVHVLTPLVQPDGSAVLVDRGFLATATRSTQEVVVPAAASGTVEVVGRVRLSESARAGLDADSTPPSVRFVALDELGGASGALVPVWVERIEQAPAEDGSLVAVPAPGLSAGPSLIYAVQWWLFGVIAVVGFVLLVRRDRRPRSPALDEDASAAS